MNSVFITTDLAEPRDFVSVRYPAVASYAVSPYLQMPTVLTLHDHEVTVEEGPEDLPAWVEPALDRLVALADLRPNWDSYGGQPLSRRHGRAALMFLAAVMADGVPMPDIVPLADGGVQLEWRDDDTEIDFISDEETGTPQLLITESSGDHDFVGFAVIPAFRAFRDRIWLGHSTDVAQAAGAA